MLKVAREIAKNRVLTNPMAYTVGFYTYIV